MAKENKRFGRWLFSVVAAIAAAVLILYGCVQISMYSSLSDKNMRLLADGADLETIADKDALSRAVNTVIYKWTNAFSTSSVYVTQNTVAGFFDEAKARDVLGTYYCAEAHTLKTGEPAAFETKDLLPLTETLRSRVSDMTGREIPEEAFAEELESAVRFTSAQYPRLVRRGLGIIMIVIAVLLLGVMLFVRRENLFMGGFYLLFAAGVPAVICLVLSKLSLSGLFTIPDIPLAGWLTFLKNALHGTGLVCLIPAVIGLGLMIAYQIDKKHVKQLVSNKRREDVDL